MRSVYFLFCQRATAGRTDNTFQSALFHLIRNHRVCLGLARHLQRARDPCRQSARPWLLSNAAGAWKMEGRTNSKAELAAVEQRLNVRYPNRRRGHQKRSSKLSPCKRCHPACGGIAKSANGSATASIFKLLARSSWIYAASWRQPRTTKNWTPVRGSCAKPDRLRRLLRSRIPFRKHSLPH